MIALKAYKDTTDLADTEKSFFDIQNKEDILYKFETNSYKRLSEKREDRKIAEDAARQESQYMRSAQMPGIPASKRTNFFSLGYLILSVGFFVGLGSFSKKYC